MEDNKNNSPLNYDLNVPNILGGGGNNNPLYGTLSNFAYGEGGKPNFASMMPQIGNKLGGVGKILGGASKLAGAAGPIGMAVGALGTLGMGIWGAVKAKNARKKAKRQEKKARKQMNDLKSMYSNIDTSNPFLNMENKMEDLTINQKQARFQKEQFQQSQANIMGELKGAAGGSGIAGLAQELSRQSQIAAQQSSASIGAQESANQKLAAQEASRIQNLERQGEVQSRQAQREQVGTLLGMSQQEVAAYAQQGQEAQAAGWQALTSGVSGLTNLATAGLGGGDSAKSGLSMEDLKKLIANK